MVFTKLRRRNYTFATGLIGLFLLILGMGFTLFGTRSLTRMWAWEKLTLKNGSEAMTRWIRPPQPISMKIYIFNVTNPEAVSEGELPILSEIGPYVYEQSREKVNIVQLDNYTLSYQLQNIIKFKPRRSGRLRESDPVTILNVPLAGAILSVYETVPEFVGLLDDIWHFFYPGQTNIFIKTTVKDILFNGITIDCTSKITEVYVACRGLESRKSYSIRKEGKNFKFSFLYSKNGTSSETYQVNQGIFDLKKSAQYLGMNFSPSTKVWKNHYCDMVNGSDGAQFPLLVSKTDKIYIFEKELCRSVYAEFEKELIRKGVVLYKFSNTDTLFASPEENPNNHCFCRTPLKLRDLVASDEEVVAEGEEHERRICFLNGTLPLMPCIGAPIVASFPHFYMGDQSYINYSGLNPSKKLHETFVQIEPISGIAVRGFKRIQFNVELKRITEVQITSKLIDGLFPILWLEEAVELSPELFKLLRYTLIQKKVLEVGTYVLVGIGALFMIVAFVIGIVKEKQNWQASKIADASPTEGKSNVSFWQKPINVSNKSVKFDTMRIEELQNKFVLDNFMH